MIPASGGVGGGEGVGANGGGDGGALCMKKVRLPRSDTTTGSVFSVNTHNSVFTKADPKAAVTRNFVDGVLPLTT